jgi:hypothetical protein
VATIDGRGPARCADSGGARDTRHVDQRDDDGCFSKPKTSPTQLAPAIDDGGIRLELDMLVGLCARDFGRIMITYQERLADALPHVPGAGRHVELLDVLGRISRKAVALDDDDAEAEIAVHHHDDPAFVRAVNELERLAEDAAALDNGSDTDELVRVIATGGPIERLSFGPSKLLSRQRDANKIIG